MLSSPQDVRSQENLTVALDVISRQYDIGDTARINGKVSSIIPGEAVKIKWTTPGKTNIIREVIPGSGGSFATSLELDENKWTGGKWRVTTTYAKATASETFIVSDPFFEADIRESIRNNLVFEANEQVTLKGKIYNKEKSGPRIPIVVVDPAGKMTEYNILLDGREFTLSFVIEGPVVSYGEWTIEMKYSGHRSAETFDVIPSPVAIKLNNEAYLPGEKILVEGMVNALAVDNRSDVIITVKKPDATPFGSYLVPLGINGSIAYEIGLTGWQASTVGNWTVIAEYDKHKAVARFTIAESSPITVETSVAEFLPGERVNISGRVSELAGAGFVALHVLTESGRLQDYAEARVHENFTYSYDLVDPDILPGTYEILALYNGKEARTHLVAKHPPPLLQNPPINSNDTNTHSPGRLVIDDRQFEIGYTLTPKNSINKLMIDKQARTFIVVLEGSSDGTLMIELPRELIDALNTDGTDTKFLISRVYSNGTIDSATFIERSSKAHRTLSVDFGHDTELIVIAGTQVIPEFNTSIAVTMTAAFFTVIASYLKRTFRRI